MKFMLGVVKEIREEIEGKLPKGSKLALIVNGDMNTEPNLPSLFLLRNNDLQLKSLKPFHKPSIYLELKDLSLSL